MKFTIAVGISHWEITDVAWTKDIFVKLTEEARRERLRRLDAGDESVERLDGGGFGKTKGFGKLRWIGTKLVYVGLRGSNWTEFISEVNSLILKGCLQLFHVVPQFRESFTIIYLSMRLLSALV